MRKMFCRMKGARVFLGVFPTMSQRWAEQVCDKKYGGEIEFGEFFLEDESNTEKEDLDEG